ncbi:cytidylyltransferase domain-containing protein [Tenacibaculum sp. 190524A02b]|uniref:cytidylyltransferase domain-containing protein n=1 Tax=Tenacibaculum vairaonense TaxID=3137860 RepID=UPI0031FB4750
MSLGIIVQARLGSTRLPNKIILPIESNNTFLDVLLSKLKENFRNIPIILATSKNSENSILEEYAQKYEINFYRGDEYNVLKRFVDCAREYKIKSIIRICSDNPFLDVDSLKSLISLYGNQDYYSYKVNSIPAILTHYGFFAEIVSLVSLEKVLLLNNKNCLEHVTNCIYMNPDEFDVKFEEISIKEDYIRCTLDTKLDFQNLKTLYFQWYKGGNDISLKSLISFVQRKGELKKLMKQEILNNRK